MEGYNITSYCICGSVNNYTLTFPRWPVVSVGAVQTETVMPDNEQRPSSKVADINLCRDEKRYLSRSMLYFAYDKNKLDWVIGAGMVPDDYTSCYKGFRKLGEDKNRESNRQQIFCLYKEDFKRLLNKQVPRLIKGDKLACESVALNNYFKMLSAEPVALQELAGIGIFPTGMENGTKLYYKGKEHTFINCPFLGQLPFGWYIDITNHSGITLENIKQYARTLTLKN